MVHAGSQPGTWFDLELIPTPSRHCPRSRSPITSGDGKVCPFPLGSVLAVIQACPFDLCIFPWSGLPGSEESDRCTTRGDETARMLAACSLARLLLAYVGLRYPCWFNQGRGLTSSLSQLNRAVLDFSISPFSDLPTLQFLNLCLFQFLHVLSVECLHGSLRFRCRFFGSIAN